MKYLVLMLLPIAIFSQEKFKVEYERRFFINLNDPNPESKKLREEVFSKPKYIELSVDKNQCLSKEVERIDNSQGANYKMRVIGGFKDLEVFTDFEKNAKIILREMDSKLYLINDSITQNKWNLTRETKKINGYEAKKAIFIDNDYENVAWYSTSIKSKCGPENYDGLPGLLLELKRTSLKDEKQYSTYKLESIQVDDKLKIQSSNKGKQVSKADFEKIEDEYYKKIEESMNQKRGVDKN